MMNWSAADAGPPLPTYWNSNCGDDYRCYGEESPGARIRRKWREDQGF
jgi:hypothetical protein